jgi:predicted  nucleic acid-binding Zn-ribbon protein
MGRKIQTNFSRRKNMAKSARDYATEIRTLKNERDALQEELDDANDKLSNIDSVLYGEEEEDDDEEDEE